MDRQILDGANRLFSRSFLQFAPQPDYERNERHTGGERQSPLPYDNFAASAQTATDRKANNRRCGVLCVRTRLCSQISIALAQDRYEVHNEAANIRGHHAVEGIPATETCTMAFCTAIADTASMPAIKAFPSVG